MWTPAQADFLTGYLNSSSIQLQVAAVTFPAKKSAKNLSHPASLIYMHILYTHMHTHACTHTRTHTQFALNYEHKLRLNSN